MLDAMFAPDFQPFGMIMRRTKGKVTARKPDMKRPEGASQSASVCSIATVISWGRGREKEKERGERGL